MYLKVKEKYTLCPYYILISIKIFMKKIIIILLIFINCLNFEEEKRNNKDYLNFLAAYFYKSSQCNSQPPFFLVLPERLDRIKYEQCLFWIIRMDCPFSDYPLLCYQLHKIEIKK